MPVVVVLPLCDTHEPLSCPRIKCSFAKGDVLSRMLLGVILSVIFFLVTSFSSDILY